MSATERLRAMLDERGVEHVDAEDGHTQHTWWSDGDHEICASNSGERLAVYNLTPEQAIEATLGRGECERLQDENERLRSCLSDSAENAKQIMHEAHVQEEENAKLRELVRELYEDQCDECDEWKYADRMRELGIEVS